MGIAPLPRRAGRRQPVGAALPAPYRTVTVTDLLTVPYAFRLVSV